MIIAAYSYCKSIHKVFATIIAISLWFYSFHEKPSKGLNVLPGVKSSLKGGKHKKDQPEYALQKLVCEYLRSRYPDIFFYSDTVASIRLTLPIQVKRLLTIVLYLI